MSNTWKNASVWSRIHGSLFRQHNAVNVDYNDLSMEWTIIKNNLSYKEYKNRFGRFQRTFKYKFLLPIVLLGHSILGKYIIRQKDIADEPHNVFIRGWNDNLEYSLKEWCLYYRRNKVKDASDDYKHDASVDMVRKINDIFVTAYMHDTAYRALWDMVLTNWAIKMGDLFPGKIGHFVYMNKCIDDKDFKTITGKTNSNIILDQGDHVLIFPPGNAYRVEKLTMIKTEPKNPVEVPPTV